MSEVTIILPTYNRIDVIGRAIASIILQTHQDWELLVVDDGSSDGTIERLEGLDPRIRFIRQANQGVAAARNTGLSASRGRYIAFMDSDDEWRPEFLALTTAFLRAHPDEHWVATESHEDLGDGSAPIHHSRHDIGGIYLGFARSIGSRALELPPGVDDDYLRIYERKDPIGDWGSDILQRMGLSDTVVYSGHTLQHMRWGYLNWLPATVCTRHAIETAGFFSVAHRSAEDLRYFGILAHHFRANLIAVPLAIKYERASGNQKLAQSHLATGAGAYRFEVNKLSCFDDNFGPSAGTDPEIGLLRQHYCLEVAHRALAAGHREVAIQHLQQAAAWRPMLWKAWPMLALALLVPNDERVAGLYVRWNRGFDVVARLLSGRLKPAVLLSKLKQVPQRGRAVADYSGHAPLSLTDSALAPFEQRNT
ncbi:glycosyltransferase family A protein [Sphaerotilus sp.]|uniref:glycosyltransferase family 2 protein n=1 Tax=Sphaerotilus sp. TaxID=2093942 RepID=UPI00286E9E82|nr:glycosyltransferase family A protein [Sphaerotilus sp.]